MDNNDLIADCRFAGTAGNPAMTVKRWKRVHYLNYLN